MKNKKEQIEEMAESVVSSAIVSNAKIDNKVAINLNKFVENMLRIGYRKATEVIDEFVERLKELLNKHEHRSQTDGVPFYQMNAESFCDELNTIAAEMRQEVEK